MHVSVEQFCFMFVLSLWQDHAFYSSSFCVMWTNLEQWYEHIW